MCKIFLFVLFVVEVSFSVQDSNMGDDRDRIVEGTFLDHKLYPFAVAIQRLENGVGVIHCAGSIMSSTAVLTACHCIMYANGTMRVAKIFRVVAGTSKVGEGRFRQVTKVYQVSIDPGCKSKPLFHHDIGVMLVDPPFQYSVEVQPMKVYSRNVQDSLRSLQGMMATHNLAWAMGWGFTDAKKTPATAFKGARVRLLTTIECQEKMRAQGFLSNMNYLEIKLFCVTWGPAGTPSGITNNGDSGGPLVIDGLVYGVLSSGTTTQKGSVSLFSTTDLVVRYFNRYADDVERTRALNSEPISHISSFHFLLTSLLLLLEPVISEI